MTYNQFNTSDEIWKAIPGFEGYEASTHGRVRSYRKNQDPRYINRFPPMILKPSSDRQNYSLYCLYKDGKPHYLKGHQLVLLTFVGPCPPGMESCHEDGNPAHNWLSNLRWDSRKNNHADKLKHGTTGNGEKNNMAKLTAKQVIKIRELASQGVRQSTLGELFGVSFQNISCIVRRKRWKHI